MTDPVSTERLKQLVNAAFSFNMTDLTATMNRDDWDDIRQVLTELIASRQAPEGVRVTEAARRAFYSKAEVTREGFIRNFDEALLAALSAIEPVTQTVSEEMAPDIHELRNMCAASQFHDHDGCACTELELRTRFSLNGSTPSRPPAAVSGRRGIYMASKVKHASRWVALRDDEGVPVISTWIDEAGEGQSSDLADLWRRCVLEASTAGALVVYREPGETLKGAWVEVGAALASGVPVYAVGIEEFTIANDRRIKHFDTLEAALTAALKGASHDQP